MDGGSPSLEISTVFSVFSELAFMWVRIGQNSYTGDRKRESSQSKGQVSAESFEDPVSFSITRSSAPPTVPTSFAEV